MGTGDFWLDGQAVCFTAAACFFLRLYITFDPTAEREPARPFTNSFE